jgi:hypothetical protein
MSAVVITETDAATFCSAFLIGEPFNVTSERAIVSFFICPKTAVAQHRKRRKVREFLNNCLRI